MDRSEAKKLLRKYNRGEATAREIAILESWYIEEGFRKSLFEGELDYETKRLRILSKIQQKRTPVEKATKLWPYIAAAAAVATIIFGAGLFFYKIKQKQDIGIIASANDIAPGKQGATLTLADGKKIRLSDVSNGEIAKEAGIVVTKTAEGQLVYEIKANVNQVGNLNILSTANGETYKVRLPDGSLAWLNAASTLTYATDLNKQTTRTVRLEGEGYFEIKKDKAHPFIVESKGQRVEVLGTHFNVNSYTDESAVATTLVEGSVKVIVSGKQRVLIPGEQSNTMGSDIKVEKVDLESIIDWREGDFYLKNVNFRSAMRKIARWYDVDVIFDPSVPENIKSNGYISRTNQLSVILKLIEKSGKVHFKIEGKTVYVSR